MKGKQTPEQMARALPLDRLADVLNQTTLRLPGADMSDPVWRVYSVVSRESCVRLAPHYGEVSDEELAAVMLLCLSKPSQGKTGLEDIVMHLVEDELRSRFPEASAAADAVLGEMELSDESVGEYDYLKVLLRESGVQL